MNFEAITRELSVTTRGKGTYEITGQLKQFVAESGIQSGQLTVFVQHTSASLVIMKTPTPMPGLTFMPILITSFLRRCPF